jgi:hypothetical protein
LCRRRSCWFEQTRLTHASGEGPLDHILLAAGDRHKIEPERLAEHKNKNRTGDQIRSMQRGKLGQRTNKKMLNAVCCSPFAPCLGGRFGCRCGRGGASGPQRHGGPTACDHRAAGLLQQLEVDGDDLSARRRRQSGRFREPQPRHREHAHRVLRSSSS